MFFVALDENDMAVKRMQSFTTVQPGEVSGCIGCHERRTETVLPHGHRPGRCCAGAKPNRADRRLPRRVRLPPRRAADSRQVVRRLPRLSEDRARRAVMPEKCCWRAIGGPMFSHAYFTMTVRRLFSDNRNQPKSNYPPRMLGSSASRILKMLDGSHYGVRADKHAEEDAAALDRGRRALSRHVCRLGLRLDRRVLENDQVQHRRGLADNPRRRRGDRPPLRILPPGRQGLFRGRFPTSETCRSGQFDLNDPRLRMSRHIVFNLTRPEKSLLLLAPLAESAGGFGLCRDEQGEPATVFSDTADADYKKLLAMVTAGKENLDAIKRFDMPGFRPCAAVLARNEALWHLAGRSPRMTPRSIPMSWIAAIGSRFGIGRRRCRLKHPGGRWRQATRSRPVDANECRATDRSPGRMRP